MSVCICVYNVCVCVSDPSLAHFLSAELTRGYFLEHNEAQFRERREKVYTCMRIPKELEKVRLHPNHLHLLVEVLFLLLLLLLCL